MTSKEKIEKPGSASQKVSSETNELEEAIYNRVLGGEFNNIPPTARKLVRIFTSSTFTGFILFPNEFPIKLLRFK